MTSLSWKQAEDGSNWSYVKLRVLVTWALAPGLLSHGWAVFDGETGKDVARGQSGSLERARFTAKYAAENRKLEVLRPLPKPHENSKKGVEKEERWWARPSPSANGNWHVGTVKKERIIVVRGETSAIAEALAARVRDLLNGEKP